MALLPYEQCIEIQLLKLSFSFLSCYYCYYSNQNSNIYCYYSNENSNILKLNC